MCFTLFRSRRKYYYKVSHYSDDKYYYIMCNKCYKILPKHLQNQNFNPEKDKFLFKFDDEKMLLDDLIINKECQECFNLNNHNFYENMNNVLGIGMRR